MLDPAPAGLLLVLRADRQPRELVRARMSAATPAHNRDESNAVNLADEHADESIVQIRKGNGAAAYVYALLSVGARVDALRETLNRELPDLADAVIAAIGELPKD